MTGAEAVEVMLAGGWCRPSSWAGTGSAITFRADVGLVEVPDLRGGRRARLYAEMLTEEWERVEPERALAERGVR